MEGLEECLTDSRIAVFMCNATDDPVREAQHVESLLAKRVDGIIVTARRADRRSRLKVPTQGLPVLYVFSQSDDPNACCLIPDDEGGAVLAVDHLARLGRKRIAHVTGPERFEAVRLRRDGYRKTLARHGLGEPDGFYLPGVWSEGWGREAVAQLFRGRVPPPDAIFCGNDQIARGVSDALRERGIVVPDAVSIVGFDNWEIIAEATRPPLTTVDMNLSELGREAGSHLIRLIAGEPLHGIRRLPCTPRRPRFLRRKARAGDGLTTFQNRGQRDNDRTAAGRLHQGQHGWPLLARAARHRAQHDDSEPACAARRARHSRVAEAAQAGAAAPHPGRQPRHVDPGVLGLRHRQVDRGGELRAPPPPRPGRSRRRSTPSSTTSNGRKRRTAT